MCCDEVMKLKWTIHELVKKAKTDNSLDFTLDLNRFLTEDLEDLVELSETKVNGYYEYDETNEIFDFHLDIETTLTMLCALTLREVFVPLDFTSKISFASEFVDDDTHLIDGITLDIDQYVFSEILIEKPMKVYSPHALEEYKEDIQTMDEEEKLADSPFAKIIK